MQKNTNFNDDLIGGTQEPIIIQQGGGSDKKFIYTILILLVILFIIVLGAVAYFGSKFFSNSNVVMQNPAANAAAQPSVAPVSTPTAAEKKTIVKEVVKKEPKPQAVAKVEAAPKKEIKQAEAKEEGSIKELESILESSTPKAKEAKKQSQPKPQNTQNNQIAQAVNKATGGVKLSPQDLQKIAQLVAQQLAQSQKASATPAKTKETKVAQKAPANEEEALVQSLQAAATDTLAQENIDTASVKIDSQKEIQTNQGNKKVDTFNKVVVKANSENTDDEFAKLSQEIDTILQSEDAQKAEKKAEEKLSSIVKARKQELRFIVVKPGDTLSSLARRAYGRASAYVKIYKANPDLVKNPNRIYVGQKLRVPVDNEYQGNAR